MWLSEELDVCVYTSSFFRGVSELKCNIMEENKFHTYSRLLPTNEAHSDGRNPSLWCFWVLRIHTRDISYKRIARGCLSCPHTDTQGWLRKDAGGVWKRSRNMYFPNNMKTSINVFPQ